MPLTDSGKNKALAGFAQAARTAALFVGVPTNPANELLGGSPSYARRPVTFDVPKEGGLTLASEPQFDVPAGAVVQYVAFFGAYRDLLAWYALDPKTFDVQSTYTLKSVAAGNIVLVDGSEIEPEPGTINLLTTSAEVTQGATLTLQASRTGGASGIARVDYAIAGGPSGTITWAANESGTQTIQVAIPADMDTGDAAITLSNPVNASLGSTTSGTVTVNAAVVPSAGEIVLLTTSVSVQVGGTYEVQCLRQNGSTGAASATATVTDSDGQSHTFNWAAGEGGIKSQTFTAPANAGTYTLALTSVSGASTGDVIEGTVTVVAVNHGRIDLVLTSQTIDAGDKIVVRAERTQGSDGLASVDYALSTGEDGTLTWLDGESGTKQATIATTGGASIITHDVTITLSGAKGAALGTSSGSATVKGPSGTINLDTTSVTVTEGEDATLKFTRDGGKNGAVGAKYSLSNGASGTITWADKDDAPKTETIPTQAGDGGSTWTVTLDSVMGAAKGTDSGTITIESIDQPGTVNLVTTSTTVGEGKSFVLVFERTGGHAGAATASYSISDGRTGTVSWGDGVSGTKSVTLPAGSATAGQTLTATLTSVDGAAKGANTTATITITASAKPGVISLSAAHYSVADGGTTTITLKREGGTDGEVSVGLSSVDGTAKAGTDYTAVGKIVTWADGDGTDKTVTVAAKQPTGGAQVATVKLDAPDAGTYPFTFGHPFKQGDVPAGLTVGTDTAGVSLQCDHKVTYPDGSLRHAIFSGSMAVTQGRDNTISLVTKTPATVTPIAQSALPAEFDASIELTDTTTSQAIGTVTLSSLTSNAPVRTWLEGDQASEWHWASDVISGTTLSVHFHVRLYADGRVRCAVNLENTTCFDTNMGRYTLDATIKIAGTEVWSHAWEINAHARTSQVFWYGGDPDIMPVFDKAYWVSTQTMVCYDATQEPIESYLADWASTLATQDHEPGSRWVMPDNMGTAGGHPHIGPNPEWVAGWFMSQDRRMWRCMDVFSRNVITGYASHYRDETTGHVISLEDYPRASTLGAVTSTPALPARTMAVVSPGKADTSHVPSPAYMPYLATGDYFFLEEEQFWGIYAPLTMNWAYRQEEKSLILSQPRGGAWGNRNLFNAATITPDNHPMKDYLVRAAGNNIDFLLTKMTNDLGILTDWGYNVVYDAGGEHIGLAPWQLDYFVWSAGYIYLLGWTRIHDFAAWMAKYPLGRLTSPDYCANMGCLYNMQVRDTTQGPYYTKWSEIYAGSVRSVWSNFKYTASEDFVHLTIDKCGTSEMMDVAGKGVHEFWNGGEYPGWFRLSASMAPIFHSTNGQAAWDKFMTFTNYKFAGDGLGFDGWGYRDALLPFTGTRNLYGADGLG